VSVSGLAQLDVRQEQTRSDGITPIVLFQQSHAMGQATISASVLSSGVIQYGDIWISIFPQSEEILVGFPGFLFIACKCLRAAKT
jgi:hypothetical protein